MIARFKAVEDLSVDELLLYRHGGELPETDEYREARAAALEVAGLEPDQDAAPSELSVADHLRRLRRSYP